MNDETRLAAFEKMYAEVFSEQEKLKAKLFELRSQGKEKTVAFREAMAKKLSNGYVIGLFEKYGLTERK